MRYRAPMQRLLPLVLLAACTGEPEPEEEVTCVAGESRSYDTAADPDLYFAVDPGAGISNEDVDNAFLGSFTGTFTPTTGDAVGIELSMGVDGDIVVTDYERSNEDANLACPSVWTAPLVFAMSSDKVNDAYIVDDLWSPEVVLTDLSTAELSGDKPTSEFDGTLEITGDRIAVSAAHNGTSWSGTLTVDGEEVGTWTASR